MSPLNKAHGSIMRRVLGLVALLLALVVFGPPSALASGVWSAPTKIGIRNPGFISVSCPSATFCAAVTSEGEAMTYNGTSWTAPVKFAPEQLTVSCSSVTFCAAFGQSEYVLTHNGTSRSAATRIVGNGIGFWWVSCASERFCFAVDGYSAGPDVNTSYVLTYNGTSWSSTAQIDGFEGGELPCSSATFCGAVNGDAQTNNGTSWSALTNLNISLNDLSVSCSSATFCAAVTPNGNALTYNGTSWSAPTKIVHGAVGWPGISISCALVTFCVAVSTIPGAVVSKAEAMTYNGTSWSSPTHIGSALTLESVSCASATFCVAVGYQAGVSDVALTYTTANAPKNTGLPRISGKDKVKSKLTASKGVWTGTAPIAYKYQWEACNARAKKCQMIKGATKSALIISAKYVGRRMGVTVTATNSVGSAKVFSKATPVIESSSREGREGVRR